jgi:autoinducer 2-binding periplasmic protein LuxP
MGIPWEITDFLTTPEDHVGQASHVETVLANPDAFDFALFAPTEWEGQKSNVRQLAEAVPTLAYDVANPFYDLWGTDESPFTHISFDHEVGALLLCEWTIEETGGEGEVALLRGVPGFVDNLRSQTFADCIEENSDLEVVTEVFADFDRELGFSGANTMLTSHPDIVMMHTASTGMSLGAIAAMRERDVLDDVIVNGWGGGSEELAELVAGTMDVTVFRLQDDWGVVGADMIRMYLEGRQDEIPGVISPGMLIMDHTWSEDDIDEQTEIAFRYSGDIDR